MINKPGIAFNNLLLFKIKHVHDRHRVAYGYGFTPYGIGGYMYCEICSQILMFIKE